MVGLIAASTVLSISSIPWDGAIGAVRVGQRADGSFMMNAMASELEADGALDLVVAGTPERLVMVESGAKEVPEEKILEAIKWGLDQTQPVIEFIDKIVKELGVVKAGLPVVADDSRVVEDSVEEQARKAVQAFVQSAADSHIFNSVKVSRKERVAMVDAIKEGAKAYLNEKGIAPETHDIGLKDIKKYVSEEISKRILENGQRLDGRTLDEIRTLDIQVDLVPRVHGSGMFMRGDTQVLSVVTLGAPGDAQTLDSMEEEGTKRYMHHYNDAPFTYGETGPMRGPGRRAIGHGALAERALQPVLPAEIDFPYVIRVVSEVMGSNGSSSMASTCGSTLSLMAAGVPIKKPVAGIAMGLASDAKTGAWKVLTDLQDVEDGPGGMDFKITGTREGITAIQMDTKTSGLTWDIVKQTIVQAREARLKILNAMEQVIAAPRAELSPYAPRIETLIIDPSKIGDVIGPGGKTIKKIIEQTGVDIDIEQDGRVLVTSVDAAAMAQAIEIIRQITKEVVAGEIYEGTVVRLEDFGAFVQILPNKDGLVHVSEIKWERVGKPGDILNMGDKVQVKVKEIDNLGRVNLSMKALLPRPEGYVEPTRPAGGFGGGHRGGPGGGHGGPRGGGKFFRKGGDR